MAAVETQDYYTTLGIKRDADEKAIKAAFRKLARKFHPDVNPGDKASEEHFKDLNQAYEVLSEPASRKLYDRYGNDWTRYRDAGFTGDEPKGRAPRPDFSTYSGGSPNGNSTSFQFDSATEAGGLGDFMQSMFGGRRGERFGVGSRGKQRGEDLQTSVPVSFDESFRGTTRRLDLRAPDTCSTCDGAGYARGAPCPTCDGTGVVTRVKTIEVKIPAGVKAGSKIRVKGQGGPGLNGGSHGDVILRVDIAPNDLFERDGDNLKSNVEVPLYTALLGGEVVVNTPSGKVALTIPPESQNGRVFRLRQQGMPKLKGAGDDRGDLFARLSVALPSELSDRERELLKQLQAIRANPAT